MNLEELKREIAVFGILAKRLGGSVSISVSIPVDEADKAAEPPTEPPPEDQRVPVATMKTLMWTLNQLKSAPGQPNRELMRKFLYVKGWIGPTDQPEAWDLIFVPINKAKFMELYSQVAEFELANRPKPKEA
jgi:hypothetical protein